MDQAGLSLKVKHERQLLEQRNEATKAAFPGRTDAPRRRCDLHPGAAWQRGGSSAKQENTMATNFGRYGFGDEDEDASPEIGNPGIPADDQVPSMEPLEGVGGNPTPDDLELPVEMDLIRWLVWAKSNPAPRISSNCVASTLARGLAFIDGSVRDGEEPGELLYVDLVDYETGETKRAWGVILGDVMRKAISAYNLEPGSRIHLKQQGKRQVIIDEVNSRNEMQIRQTYANGWTCLQDRGLRRLTCRI